MIKMLDDCQIWGHLFVWNTGNRRCSLKSSNSSGRKVGVPNQVSFWEGYVPFVDQLLYFIRQKTGQRVGHHSKTWWRVNIPYNTLKVVPWHSYQRLSTWHYFLTLLPLVQNEYREISWLVTDKGGMSFWLVERWYAKWMLECNVMNATDMGSKLPHKYSGHCWTVA